MDQRPPLASAEAWFTARGWQPFPFQRQTWAAYLAGQSGLLNAPTGSGKTLALWVPALLEALAEPPAARRQRGLRLLWVTPLRALAQDLHHNLREVAEALGVAWEVGLRTGDSTAAEKRRQQRRLPEALVTTPESIHVLLSQKDSPRLFRTLRAVVVDEWHELLGTKRGVQVELALSRLRCLTEHPPLKVWGISATIGNLDEALTVLTGPAPERPTAVVRADVAKRLRVETLLPDPVERFPWAGSLGLTMLDRVVPLLRQSRSTLVFCNTRAAAERWYQQILRAAPELAGEMALHHGAIDRDLRQWVEGALRVGGLKVVVCTSSLDLGVDFAPVETVVQIGSPKGVGRFLQRAGRSGHQPGAESVIYFVPTQSLELIEAAALKEAIDAGHVEARPPLTGALDVLVQYLVTLAVGPGFEATALREEIQSTHAYHRLSDADWRWALDFVQSGGEGLTAYDEFARVTAEDGIYRVADRRTALRHRVSMGTIVSAPMLSVRLQGAGRIGQVDEDFVARLRAGDTFWLAGRNLEFVRLKDLTVYAKKSRRKTGAVPRWTGSRLPLSSQLADHLRACLEQAAEGDYSGPELTALRPVFAVQQRWSALPRRDELLFEQLRTREGHHLFVYPFEGRPAHELLATLWAYRLGQRRPQSFTYAMNDYGFELLSDRPIPFDAAALNVLLSPDGLTANLEAAVNAAELARRRFREIAVIAGLVFTGYPGRPQKSRHLQSSAQLMYDVLRQYDPDNPLLRQAHAEATVGEAALEALLGRLRARTPLVLLPEHLTPLAFPLWVDHLREKLTSEKLEDRIAKMTLALERYAEG